MRLLLANDLYGRSSAAGVAVRMAEGLAARGHEVSFLTTVQQPDQAGRSEQGGVDVWRVFTPPYPLRFRAWKSLGRPSGTAAMGRAVEQLRPDLVHVHNLHIHLGYGALAAARARGAAVVLQVHDVMPFCHQKLFCHLDERLAPGDPVRYRNGPVKCALCVKTRYNPWRNRTIRAVLARDVDRLLAVSGEMARALASNGIAGARVVPNALPDAPPVSAREVDALRARLGLEGDPVILHGGRLDRLKGSLELVRALELVRRQLPRARLLLVGEALPGFSAELLALARRLGLGSDALVFSGWLEGEALRAAYALAEVVATPSLCFESFGLINLEAMLAGRPLVASFWGGPSDVVLDGQTGYLVNPLQVDVLAERLTRILSDPVLAARLGQAGRLRALEAFSSSGQISAVESVYRELCP